MCFGITGYHQKLPMMMMIIMMMMMHIKIKMKMKMKLEMNMKMKMTMMKKFRLYTNGRKILTQLFINLPLH